MTERQEDSGRSDLAPGSGNDNDWVPREELKKVVSQRDGAKEELRSLRAKTEEAENSNQLLQSRMETELNDKNLSEQQRQELENRLRETESQYLADQENLKGRLKELEGNLEHAEKQVGDFLRDKTLTEEESIFLDAAKRAAYSHQNAEILLGYLRGRGRVRSVPVYADEDKKAVQDFHREVECFVPREEGSGYAKQFLPIEEAMPHLKQELKNLAPALASGGGHGSHGSDGYAPPGVLNRNTMNVENYKASRPPISGEVLVQ